MKELKRTMYLLSHLEIAQDLLVNSLDENQKDIMIKYYINNLEIVKRKFDRYYNKHKSKISVKNQKIISKIYSGQSSWFDLYVKVLPRRL